MNCQNCGYEISAGARFCEECGTPVAKPASQPAVAASPARTGTKTGGRAIHSLAGHNDSVIKVAFAPDGRQALSAGANGEICIWDIASGRLVNRISGEGYVRSADFSADGSRVLCDGDAIVLKRLPDGGVLGRFGASGPVSEAVAFLPDGVRALYSKRNKVVLGDAQSGSEIKVFEGHTDDVTCLAASLDGKRGLSGRFDPLEASDSVLLWDLQTGQSRRLRRPIGLVSCVGFSPDGRLALAGTYAAEICLWRTETGEDVRRYVGHDGNVLCVAFSPSGRHFLSGSGTDAYDADLLKELGVDNTVRLWSIDSGGELARFEGHTGNVNSVAVSPDGRLVLSGSSDKTVRLWSLP